MDPRRTLTVAFMALPAILGCGLGSSGPTRVGSTVYPALAPDIAQIVDHGGTVLKSPKIVTVTWTADPNEKALEDFGDKLGASAYWKTVVGDYGVGAGTSGPSNHVRISTPPPAAIADADLETWLAQQVMAAPKGGWPVWDAQTAYVVYVPTATRLTSGGVDACSTYASLHAEVSVGKNQVTYVFIDENCHGTRSVLDGTTGAASHEIAEATVNPHPYTDKAWGGFDTAHAAWSLIDDSDHEIGDVCENYTDAFFTGPADLPYLLQRLWSNSSARAGHSPCVPQSTEPYFNVTATDMATLNVQIGTTGTPENALGYQVPVGSTKTLSVTFYSDAPTGYWDLAAVEGDGIHPVPTKHLKASVANSAGLNGEQAEVTVTITAAPSSGDALALTIVSTAPGHTTHYMPILLGSY